MRLVACRYQPEADLRSAAHLVSHVGHPRPICVFRESRYENFAEDLTSSYISRYLDLWTLKDQYQH